MADKKRNARYTSGRLYGKQALADVVVRDKPQKNGTETKEIVRFPVEPGSGKKADEYASELQRETRGLKKGGMVRGAGCEIKGKTRGRVR